MTGFAELKQAYANTHYVAQLGESDQLTLRPGCRNPMLDSWMRAQGIEQLHVLTACNPRSQICSVAWNQQAMHDLKQQLHKLKWKHWPCCNQAQAGDWPEEESLVIAGRAHFEILDLAEQLGQYAVLEHHCGQASQLVYTMLFSPAD